ncbi:hypothetical protein J8L88_06810 [Aquimarina sp. MMG015]|uniref:hypothetical protein n=1 Tax=Aquimarina sp. MMG015 TaxID=2822689 RepID=UPI001B39F85A|nr:hypothetical protein [Aquimarina sp. MMG015]MBQ4802563.1 hypothetical protein [Aquimarina sp. MMG015]
MKNFKYVFNISIVSLILIVCGCQEEEFEFGDISAPTISSVLAEAPSLGDPEYGTGNVFFDLQGEDIITYIIYTGDGRSESFKFDGNAKAMINYAAPGINTYTYTIIAVGIGGITSSTTGEVTVFTDLDDTTKSIFGLLAGSTTADSSKTWKLDAGDEPGFYGVGPGGVNVPQNDGDLVYWWAPTSADFNEDCLFNDELTFNFDLENFTLSMSTDNMGDTWYHDDYTPGIPGGSNTAECLEATPPSVSVSITNAGSELLPEFTTDRAIELGGDGFMGLYIGNATRTYEILSIDCNLVSLRIFFFDDEEDRFNAWYLRFRAVEDATDCGITLPN